MDEEIILNTELETDNKLKETIIVLVVIVLGVATFFFFRGERTESNQFEGNLISVENRTLIVEGLYLQDDQELNPEAELIEVRIELTEETIIEREAFNVPDTEEIFYPAKLPKEKSIVELSDMVDDSLESSVGLMVLSNKNIFNKSSFEAEKIVYRVPVFSDPR